MASMTAPEFAPYLQGAAEEYAAASVLTAVTPLRGQLADLTGRLQSTSMQLLQAQAQIAALSVIEPPPLPVGWTKTTFLDDFTGTRPDGLKWNVRNNDYSANELSALTNRPTNVILDGKTLTLRAQRELYTIGATARNYTSGYLDTIGRQSQQFGRWEMRAKLPGKAAKGAWPAFWLRDDRGEAELDIMESVCGTGKTVQTLHEDKDGTGAKRGHEDASVADLTSWHVYAAEREAGIVRWFIDARQVFQVTADEALWLNTMGPMNIRLNLQVGGSMPAWYKQPVDASTVFPADFVVDYVRVLSR